MMRMQAAIVEAALSVSILVLASAAITATAFDGTSGGSGSEQQMAASYDFFRILQQNSSYAQCIDSMGSCSDTALKDIMEIYGLGYAQISMGGAYAHLGNASSCASTYNFCEPIASDGYKIMCIRTCKG
ncbi:MAG: hypothetical protein QXW10_04215 [Candidatus Micrarchaeaceae archaeon]